MASVLFSPVEESWLDFSAPGATVTQPIVGASAELSFAGNGVDVFVSWLPAGLLTGTVLWLGGVVDRTVIDFVPLPPHPQHAVEASKPAEEKSEKWIELLPQFAPRCPDDVHHPLLT